MDEKVRVYVDGSPVDIARNGTALDAVAAADADAASAVRAGTRIVVDNRGLPVEAGSSVYWGAIFRVVSARHARPADGADAAT